jgi:hypothetical protein
MKYRVLRYFEGENTRILIGHFDLKLRANLAISEDRAAHPKAAGDLKYIIDEVDQELTQEQIDRMLIESRATTEEKANGR